MIHSTFTVLSLLYLEIVVLVWVLSLYLGAKRVHWRKEVWEYLSEWRVYALQICKFHFARI